MTTIHQPIRSGTQKQHFLDDFPELTDKYRLHERALHWWEIALRHQCDRAPTVLILQGADPYKRLVLQRSGDAWAWFEAFTDEYGFLHREPYGISGNFDRAAFFEVVLPAIEPGDEDPNGQYITTIRF